ncbi:MAG: SpoIID/LytB domain-containing protein [Elusimicrobiales bacterium]|nr:SpoIID/LytB domain-containing protein [Elusimicrobiales bacterium]
MKTLLLLLLAAVPAGASGRQVDIRLYSLHKIQAISLEAEDGVQVDGRNFSGKARISIKGSQVAMDGAAKAGPEKSLRVSAAGPVWLSGPGLPRRRYTGQLLFSSDKKRLKIINSVPLETYIAGVVTGEASDLSHPEAYKAQAVTARTYIVKHLKNHSGEGYHLCDSTHCQLYTGVGSVSPKARAAAEATSGELLFYKGQPAATFYHSICGGHTEEMTSVWYYDHKPYLVSVKDGPPGKPYCAIAPRFRWKTKLYYTGLTRLARQAGWILPDEQALSLRITGWSPSGRAKVLELRTQRRAVLIQGTDFYHGIGRRAGWQAVRSTAFSLLAAKDYVLLDGAGNGHGVGMCQWGAEGMARRGFKYREILKHYYPGTETGHD